MSQPNIKTENTVTFALPKLPYSLDALAPQISEETMRYHYGRHHQTYIENLNRLVRESRFEHSALEEIVRNAEGALYNNAAQTWNHTFYFLTLSPNPKTVPTGALSEAINRDFGSFESFREQFTKASTSLFGAGWVWLAQDKNGKLSIISEPNAGNPLRNGMKPLLAFDVWEHAYYIDYRNRRADHINAIWERVDWRVVEERFR